MDWSYQLTELLYHSLVNAHVNMLHWIDSIPFDVLIMLANSSLAIKVQDIQRVTVWTLTKSLRSKARLKWKHKS